MFQVFGQMVVCDVENPQPEPWMYAGDVIVPIEDHLKLLPQNLSGCYSP